MPDHSSLDIGAVDEEDDYPIELQAPDISAHRDGNAGCSWLTTRDSGRAGPHTIITALTHGNEICGAIVLDELLRSGLMPIIGQLTFGFLNVAAFQRFDPAAPHVSRFVDEDLNRVWDTATLASSRHSMELDRARLIRPMIDTADYLLDIHSMQQATAPLLLAGSRRKSVDLARRVGFPPVIVCDRGHVAGRRLRDYDRFDDPAAEATALLVECGQHWAASSVDVARRTVFRFLHVLGQLNTHALPICDQEKPLPPSRVIEVTDVITVDTDTFTFERDFKGLEIVPEAGTLLGHEGKREVRTPYDACVLIMPSRRVIAGQTAVRLGRFTSADEKR